MGFVIVLLTLALVGVVVVVVSAPLRRARALEDPAKAGDPGAAAPPGAAHARALAELESARARDELEAAREAKYREIRDAELDFRTGKLSSEHYRAIDADLRAEAIEILNRLERGADATGLEPDEAGLQPNGAAR